MENSHAMFISNLAFVIAFLVIVECAKEPEYRCENCDKVYKQEARYKAHIAGCIVVGDTIPAVEKVRIVVGDTIPAVEKVRIVVGDTIPAVEKVCIVGDTIPAVEKVCIVGDTIPVSADDFSELLRQNREMMSMLRSQQETIQLLVDRLTAVPKMNIE
jgi:hypothetical protein